MKILPFDTESFPNIGLTWGTWDQKVIKVLKRRLICSISWSWYPTKERHTLALCDMPGYDPERYMRSLFTGEEDPANKQLIRAFAKVRAKADIAIGHNIDEFDDPMVNTDVFLNKLKAIPQDARTIDTLKVLRRRMRLNSNKLDDVCEQLGIGKKLKHPGIEMWLGCMRGEAKYWDWMKRYNAHDVDPLLVGLYEHVRPWIKNHPNLSADSESPCCPSCGHTRLSAWSWMYTQTGAYQRMRCQSCASFCRRIKRKDGSFIYRP